MPDEVELPGATVTGQRARGPSPFSGIRYPSRRGVRGPQQNELDPDPDDGGGISDEEVQCGDPAGRREWNKDAKAIEAISRFLEAASSRYGESDFFQREYGALLCEMPNGRVALGPVFDGPFVGPPVGGQGTVSIDPFSCSGSVPLGFVHSHNTGNAIPSPGDMGFLQYLADYANGNPATLSVYVITTMAVPGTGQSAIVVSRTPLSDSAAVEEAGYEPEWVNPEAEECAGNAS